MNEPKRKSKRTKKEMELLAVASRLNKVADGLPVLDEYYKKSAASFVNPETMNVSHIPVDVEVDSESYPLPLIILEEVIRRSPHRVICNTCTCRESVRCQNYPYDEFGCIHVGLATEEHNPEVVKHATIEETIAHLRKSVKAGLIPWVGHIGADNWIWDISSPFLTICLCCSCCCNSFYISRRLPKENRSAYHRLKGLAVYVDEDKCTGCGKCVPDCFAGCISIEDEKSVTDHSECTGCGVCVQVCPEKARIIRVENLREVVDEFINRLAPEVGGLPIEEYEFDKIIK